MKSETIYKIVCNYSNLDISKRCKKTRYVLLRWVYFKMCKTYTNESYESMGLWVKRDHASVTHCFKKYDYEIKNNEFLLKLHTDINEILMSVISVNPKDMISEIEALSYEERLKVIENKYMYEIMVLKNENVLLKDKLKSKHKKSNIMKKIVSSISILNESQKEQLYNYRINPFLKMNSYEKV